MNINTLMLSNFKVRLPHYLCCILICMWENRKRILSEEVKQEKKRELIVARNTLQIHINMQKYLGVLPNHFCSRSIWNVTHKWFSMWEIMAILSWVARLSIDLVLTGFIGHRTILPWIRLTAWRYLDRYS